MTFGQHLGLGRRYRELTQAELAARLREDTGKRWTEAMVASLENGRKAFTLEILVAVAGILDLPYDWFIDGPLVRRANPGYVEPVDPFLLAA